MDYATLIGIVIFLAAITILSALLRILLKKSHGNILISGATYEFLPNEQRNAKEIVLEQKAENMDQPYAIPSEPDEKL